MGHNFSLYIAVLIHYKDINIKNLLGEHAIRIINDIT